MPHNLHTFLIEQHKRVQRAIETEMARPAPDTARIAQLQAFQRSISGELRLQRRRDGTELRRQRI